MAIQESFLSRVSDAVRSGTVGKEVKRSTKWFHDKIKGLKGEVKNRFSSTNAAKFYREAETRVQPIVFKRKVSLGDLFCYYYNPKYKKTLPYYDMFPMIMLIRAEKETFLGINFHYLRPKWRAILLDRVTAKIGGGLPRWSKLRKIKQIAPTIKRYRFDHIMRKVVPIEENEQEIAIFLPTERFKKSGKTKVWSESERKFG
ncbi:hypothetical protein HX837_07555 [Marine Group I thaumarchaeote]|uniref:DNA end protector protein n=1 Tax=Marine Group I thaumarchaeote TaxID=2511932 RepID=A0A7K4MRX3_9ARCH|nr:hypothetical protein [Marine Group I thaumarchaeote]